MKTLDEIKQEVAEEYGYKSNSIFSAYEQIIINPHHISHENLSNILDQVTIRYASQFQDRIKELEDMLVKSNEIIKILDSASSDMLNEIRRSTKNHDNRTYVFFNEQIESLINKNK